jgi:hypothetical protein
MPMRKHLQVIAAIDQMPALTYRVRQYFNLGSEPLILAALRADLCHADMVLCLMRIGTRRARQVAEWLMGHPITIAPPCQFLDLVRGPPSIRPPTILRVNHQAQLRNSTRIGQTFCEFRVGRTKEQLLMRGVSRGDISRAVKRGWIEMTK